MSARVLSRHTMRCFLFVALLAYLRAAAAVSGVINP